MTDDDFKAIMTQICRAVDLPLRVLMDVTATTGAWPMMGDHLKYWQGVQFALRQTTRQRKRERRALRRIAPEMARNG